MSLVVVGSIAFDAVKTPFGERDKMLGGSAVHFSLAASFFTEVRVVGPVGDDFGDAEYDVLHSRGVNTDDIERVSGGETFSGAAATSSTSTPPIQRTLSSAYSATSSPSSRRPRGRPATSFWRTSSPTSSAGSASCATAPRWPVSTR